MRYVLDIAYRGTSYAGWQIQPNALTVQAELDQALTTLLKAPISTTGAGRTDAGVHARQLMVHFDSPQALPERFFDSLNGLLPTEIAINQIFQPKRPDFHARFDAISRAYIYQVATQKSPLEQDLSLWVKQTLDFDRLNEAANILSQYQDFASFCKLHGGNKTTLCEITHAYWTIQGPIWSFHIGADRFLRGMVRAVVGSLLEVGRGKTDLAGFRAMIEARDRSKAGPNVAAKGLALTEVNYLEGELIPLPSSYK